MESRKTVLKNLFTGQQWTTDRQRTDREQTYGYGERGEEGEMYGKSNINLFVTYGNTLPYVK